MALADPFLEPIIARYLAQKPPERAGEICMLLDDMIGTSNRIMQRSITSDTQKLFCNFSDDHLALTLSIDVMQGETRILHYARGHFTITGLPETNLSKLNARIAKGGGGLMLSDVIDLNLGYGIAMPDYPVGAILKDDSSDPHGTLIRINAKNLAWLEMRARINANASSFFLAKPIANSGSNIGNPAS